MNVSSKALNDNVILKFEVDHLLGYEENDFQGAVLKAINGKSKYIVVDLSLLNFISSWGIGMLIHGFTTAKNKGVNFIIAGVKENIMDVFKKTKIDTVLEFYSSVDLAVKHN